MYNNDLTDYFTIDGNANDINLGGATETSPAHYITPVNGFLTTNYDGENNSNVVVKFNGKLIHSGQDGKFYSTDFVAKGTLIDAVGTDTAGVFLVIHPCKA